MMNQPIEVLPSLSEYLHFLYAGGEGLVYVATKVPGSSNYQGWDQAWYTWPIDRQALIQHIQLNSSLKEVYIAPALFNALSGLKEHVKDSRVVWCEFDGKLPEDLAGVPEPNLRIRSSTKGHEHWYWRLNSAVTTEELETLNYGIAYQLGADSSGWDANQILRPPFTRNHKRNGVDVSVVGVREGAVNPSDFTGLPTPPPMPDVPLSGIVVDVQSIITNFGWNPNALSLFLKGVEVGSRSTGLMALGYHLCEMGLKDEEVFSLLLDADNRWGKFQGRQDQHRRLLDILGRARIKYPYKPAIVETKEFKPYGFLALLAAPFKMQWVVEGLMHDKGYLLVSGPSNVGKSQFSLSLAEHLVLGKQFLDYPVVKNNLRIGFFSLEMAGEELKDFVEKQAGQFTPGELQKLEENMLFYPIGEPVFLTTPIGQQWMEQRVKDDGLDGVFIDSMGSATDGPLGSEETVKTLMNWNDHLRNELGVFDLFVHHNRKGSAQNKKPNKLEDIYGNHYLTARASGAVVLWPTGSDIELITVKMRNAPRRESFVIKRDPNLHFNRALVNMGKNVKALVANAEAVTAVEEVFKISLNKEEEKTADSGGGATI